MVIEDGDRATGRKGSSKPAKPIYVNRYPILPYRPSSEVLSMILALANGDKRGRTKAINQAVIEAFARLERKSKQSPK